MLEPISDGPEIQGNLVDKDGSFVKGFAIDPVTGTSNGQLSNIVLDIGLAPPQLTSQLSVSTNLDANAPITGPFDPSNPTTSSNFQNVVTLFDSLGNGHTTTVFYSKPAANTW